MTRMLVRASFAWLLAGCSILEPVPPPPAGGTLLADYYRHSLASPNDRAVKPDGTTDSTLEGRIARALAALDADGAAVARTTIGNCDGVDAVTNGLCLLLARLLDRMAADRLALERTEAEKTELRTRLDRLDAELAAPRALAAEERIATLEKRMARQATELERLRAQLDEFAAIEPSIGARYQEVEAAVSTPEAGATAEPATP